MPAGAILLAWYGSFQHEAVHGHLAQARRMNDLMVWMPLSLWLPFSIYRRSHRTHHNFEILTDPHRDPESFYVSQQSFAELPQFVKSTLLWHNTLPGRMLLGPFMVIGQFFYGEARSMISGDRRNLAIWLWHIAGVTLVLIWIVGICELPLWTYIATFVLPGTSLTLVRSFAEHKAAHTPYERTAIVESGWFFSLLFLNNNLHFAHHRRPDLAWQALRSYYWAHRRQLLDENHGLCYRGGYLEIARRFLVRPVDKPMHPFL
ncbi:MAG: fatty acid desaturase [Geminicoccaceae bacterium]